MSSEGSTNLFTELVAVAGATDGGEQLLRNIYRDVHERYRDFWLRPRQIQKILELVPDIFPPDWRGASNPPHQRFTGQQKARIMSIMAMDGVSCEAEAVQMVIELAVNTVDYARKHRQV